MNEGQTKPKNSTLMRGVIVREERVRLIKGDIRRNLNATSSQIPTMISLMIKVITKKDTLDRLCRQL
jgi:hypothetical protein